MNRIEIFNELCVLATPVHLALLTNFIDSKTIQYKIGYSLIFLVSLNIFVNMLFIVIESGKEMVKKAKYLYNKCFKNKKQ
mmetsp:Transcript_21327/g.15599  ORF Transcript_21327/g.15599 Transcript_21327/m.15599 type:complete len:80 (-) Transcript_21327:165-404(-)